MTQGRDTTCTQDKANEVMAGLSLGNSLSKVCRDLDFKYITVYKWIQRYEDTFFKDSPRAYKMGYDAIADDCIDISDDTENDYIEREDGTLMMNTMSVQRAKIRIDTRLRLLGKFLPSKYGESTKIDQTLSGSIQVEKVIRSIVDPKK